VGECLVCAKGILITIAEPGALVYMLERRFCIGATEQCTPGTCQPRIPRSMSFRRHCRCESLETPLGDIECHQLSNFRITGGMLCQNQKVRDPEHDIQEQYTPVLGDITAIASVESPSRWNPSRATLFARPEHARVN
jgi:hypothetical protein